MNFKETLFKAIINSNSQQQEQHKFSHAISFSKDVHFFARTFITKKLADITTKSWNLVPNGKLVKLTKHEIKLDAVFQLEADPPTANSATLSIHIP